MIYQEDLREGQVVAIWAGDVDNEGELAEYLGTPFENDFGFLLDYEDLPEFTRSFSEPRLHAHYNRPFLKTDVRDLIAGFSWANEWTDEAERLCREKGLNSVKTVVVFPNLRYREELCRNPQGRLHFIGNLLWLGGAESWAALQRNRIIMPPFPRLIVNKTEHEAECEGNRSVITLVSWKGIVHLESWKEFARHAELSSDGWSPSKGCLPDGDFTLDVNPPGGSVNRPAEDSDSRPSEAQAKAFQHLLDNEIAIRNAVLEGIFKVYPEWRENYYGSQISSDAGKTYQSGWELPELFPPENMPEVKHSNELTRLIRPGTVHVLAKEIDGFVRIGFGFSCKWDEEHGLGVLTHKGKVIEVGQADTSFNDA